jgi:predicted phage-related endonuclease
MSSEQAVVLADPEHERQRYVGGSDIAGILNISPWQTPTTVYLKKTEPQDENPPTAKRKLFKRGHRWESVVSEMLVEDLESQGLKVEVLGANRRYIDPQIPYFAAEVDFELRIDGIPDIVNAELKTVSPYATKYWGESGSEEIPLYYRAQGAWGLGVTGRNVCILAPLFGADEIRTYLIPRDEETIAGMRSVAQNFWQNHVLKKRPPDPLNLDDVNKLFKTETKDKQLQADTVILEHLLRYRSLDTQITAMEAQRDEIEFQLKKAMVDSEVIMVGDKKAVSWKAQPRSWLDQSALREEEPKIHKQYMRKGSSRVFKTYLFNSTKEIE